MARKKVQIDLELLHINVNSLIKDESGNYHIYASCTATETNCHNCGKLITQSHGQTEEVIIEDLPIRDRKVFIHIKWPRFICDCDKNCTTSFKPDWLSSSGTRTKEFERYMLKQLVNSSLEDVANKFRTTTDKLQYIVDTHIPTETDWTNKTISLLGIDEIAIKKGHNYCTVIYDLSNKGQVKILSVFEGREKDIVVKELKKIPNACVSGLIGISSDMSSSYIPAINEWLLGITNLKAPEIMTVDRFHFAKMLGEAADNERKYWVNEMKVILATYKITSRVLTKLTKQSVPDSIIKKLSKLKDQVISTSDSD